MIGDQMYADQPEPCSLFDPGWFRMIGPRGRSSIFDCPRHEVRQLYQQRHRAFWSMPELTSIMQRWPTQLMIDDHDLCDNFGSRLEHGAAIWRALRDGALDAAFDYQGLFTHDRVDTRPPSFHFQMEYGPVALFMMDLRSQRGWVAGRHQVYGEEQHRDLALFLEANRRRPVVMLGLAVPLVHLSRWSSDDYDDRWDAPHARTSRDRLARLLTEHRRRCPDQRLIMISGDLHTGIASRMEWEDASCPPIHQLVSSAVSHVNPRELRGLRHQIDARLSSAKFELLHRPGMKNPYDRLNIGLVKVLRSNGGWKVRLVLLGVDGGAASAKVVFESEEI
jgi:phosphodiesterase/alkaline phosphatase D-like protein